jgi:hypothetical protein
MRRTMKDNEIKPELIERIDETKRSSIGKMTKLAFAVPIVASFAMGGLRVNEAHAQSYVSNL